MVGVSQILWLADEAAADPAETGGKAASLARLAAVHRVPPGFVLPAGLYRHAYGNGGIGFIRDAIADAYRALGERAGLDVPSVAVRSSALDEDGHDASFAGQHETFLNVRGPGAVLEAIERCWASATTERALAYRHERGLDTDGIALAVLVQALVPADAAVVAFSANPVSGDTDEIVVNASFGLGESIVGGTVTPDTWTVDRRRLAVTSRRIARKERMTVAVEGGTAEVPVPWRQQSRPSLDESQVVEVARLAVRLEEATGDPVDVEAAFARGALYLLQSRPITTPVGPS